VVDLYQVLKELHNGGYLRRLFEPVTHDYLPSFTACVNILDTVKNVYKGVSAQVSRYLGRFSVWSAVCPLEKG
jgi:hypothetical protein